MFLAARPCHTMPCALDKQSTALPDDDRAASAFVSKTMNVRHGDVKLWLEPRQSQLLSPNYSRPGSLQERSKEQPGVMTFSQQSRVTTVNSFAWFHGAVRLTWHQAGP